MVLVFFLQLLSFSSIVNSANDISGGLQSEHPILTRSTASPIHYYGFTRKSINERMTNNLEAISKKTQKKPNDPSRAKRNTYHTRNAAEASPRLIEINSSMMESNFIKLSTVSTFDTFDLYFVFFQAKF